MTAFARSVRRTGTRSLGSRSAVLFRPVWCAGHPSDDQLREESTTLIRSIIGSLETQLPAELDREALERNVLNESVGLGPLGQFLDDEEVTEILFPCDMPAVALMWWR